jgi:hypothetical protein
MAMRPVLATSNRCCAPVCSASAVPAPGKAAEPRAQRARGSRLLKEAENLALVFIGRIGFLKQREH